MIKWQLTDDLSEAFGPTEVSLDVSKPKERALLVVRAAESIRAERGCRRSLNIPTAGSGIRLVATPLLQS